MLPPGLSSRFPTKSALNTLRNVIEKQSKPIKLQDLYKEVLKEPGESTNNAWSMRYLKRVLLPTLVNQGVVEQAHVKPTVKADEKAQTLATMSKSQRQSSAVKIALHGYFGWQAKQPQPKPKLKPSREPFGSAVGVGESWAHLNKRRQRAREEVVRKEVEWLKEVEAVRRQAMKH